MNENNQLMRTTEQAKLVKDMSVYWDSQPMLEGRKAIREVTKAGKTIEARAKILLDELESCKEKGFDKWLQLTRVGNFFEEMGNLAHDQAIDLRIVAGRFRSHVTTYYEVYKPFIEKNRPNQPTIYEHFEWLTEEIQKVKM